MQLINSLIRYFSLSKWHYHSGGREGGFFLIHSDNYSFMSHAININPDDKCGITLW